MKRIVLFNFSSNDVSLYDFLKGIKNADVILIEGHYWENEHGYIDSFINADLDNIGEIILGIDSDNSNRNSIALHSSSLRKISTSEIFGIKELIYRKDPATKGNLRMTKIREVHPGIRINIFSCGFYPLYSNVSAMFTLKINVGILKEENNV